MAYDSVRYGETTTSLIIDVPEGYFWLIDISWVFFILLSIEGC